MKKILMSSLTVTLVAFMVFPSISGADSAVNEGQVVDSNEQFEVNGVEYEQKFMENESERIHKITDDEGTQTFITDKESGKITVESNYLSVDEIKKVEEKVNKLANDIKDDIELTTENDNVEIQSPTGDISWSSWQTSTITPEDKTDVSIVAAAIGSAIPSVGPIAGPLAGIFVNHNMRTGYFSYRMGTQLDTDSNYVNQYLETRIYSDSARNNLIGTETSGPNRVRAY
ncbi:hypothetical protein KFZ56_02325 [Virgibacillus sp. NKC19-3]|uniref:hypothetical protein n=1 Tax=Virgibacillus saliphilus TaxID=2831674 RepID=UPI001C9AD91A|nr:hypothetical protein [Virgibacillus sp. NKC19-3]MBY7141940.1 hypothetical protein [Virgibacillus sp. NKC19-3]